MVVGAEGVRGNVHLTATLDAQVAYSVADFAVGVEMRN